MKRILFLLIIFTLGFAETILIPEDFATIQEGIDASVDGDTVLVANGDYVENLVLDKSIVLTSYAIYDNLDEWIIFDDYYFNQWVINNSHIENTRLVGSSPHDPDYGSVILITPDSEECISPEIVGFTIQGGSGTRVLRDDNPVVLGGGILADVSDPHIHHNAFENNGSVEMYSGGASQMTSSAEDWSFDNRFENYNPRCDVEEFRLSDNLYNGNDAQYGNSMANRFHEDEFDMSGSIFDVFDCGNEESAVSTIWVKVEPSASVDYDDGAGQLCAFIGSDVYVDPSIQQECLDEGCGFQLNPFKTIVRTFELINPTDDNPITIHLASGTYSPETGEIFPINMINNINIDGEDEEFTILDAMQTGGVISMDDCKNNVLSNFSITGGYANYGGGINLDRSNPILTHMIIRNNTAVGIRDPHNPFFWGGGGIFLRTSNPIIADVIISDNFSLVGGGIELLESNPELINVSIIGNTAFDEFAEDYRGEGGGIYVASSLTDSKPFLDHVTISGNTAISGGGIYGLSGGIIRNSIIWDNSSESMSNVEETLIAYSNIQGGWDGEENIDNDPLFTDPLNNNYTLQGSSPCIDQGDPNLWNQDQDGSISDMGSTGGLYVHPDFIRHDFGEIGGFGSSKQFRLYNFREIPITIESVVFETEIFSTDTSFPITIESFKAGVINIEANNNIFEYVEDSMELVSEDLPDEISLFLSAVGSDEENILNGSISGTYPVASYRITNDLTIEVGDTVFLQPGTNFLFDGEYNFNVYGTLIAQGSESDSIIFDNFIDERGTNSNVIIYPEFKIGTNGEGDCLSDCPNFEWGVDLEADEFCNLFVDLETDPCLDDCDEETIAFIGEFASICEECLDGGYCNEMFGDGEGSGKWKGFTLDGASHETVFEYVRISGAVKLNGAGMSIVYSNPTLNHVTISSNGYHNFNSQGGGIYLEYSSPELNNIMINSNWAGLAGGIYLYHSSPSMSNITISENYAYDSGGGVYVYSSDPTMTNIRVSENSAAYYAGGMSIRFESNPTFINLEVSENTVDVGCIDDGYNCEKGSAIEIEYDSSPLFMNTIIANNIITEGEGSGVYINSCHANSSPIFINTTISGNVSSDSVGVFIRQGDSNFIMKNSIIWDNGPSIVVAENENSTFQLQYNNIRFGWEGEGNIDIDPLFTDPENGDYILQEGSPCIDTGTADIDGDGVDDITDYIGSAPDMGAYEFGESSEIMSGDTNFDGIVDILDIVRIINQIMGNSEFNDDEFTAADFNADGIVDILDIVQIVNYILP